MQNPFRQVLDRFRPRQAAAPVPGLNLCLLQKKMERFTTDRLNAAMQAAWGREYNRTTFFGMNLNDEHCIVKVDEIYIPVYFHERRLGGAELGSQSLPGWADQDAFVQISFVPGGGLISAEARHRFTGFIALLGIELANESTTGFFFQEDGVFLRRNALTRESVSEKAVFNPMDLL